MPSFFVPSDETGTSFAGPQTPSQHFGQLGSGALESAPHNLVHVQVGLPDGWMLDPSLAALDPIFWLHHANIDRLWEVWLQRAGHANTSESGWTSDVTFDFMDEAGTPQRLSPGDVASIASPFNYTYDDLPEPLPVPLVAAARRIAVPSRKAALVAATSQPTALSRQRVDVNVPRPALARRGAATSPTSALTNAPTKIYLSLEGMTADKPAGSYDIYIGVKGQQAPGREQFVARLAPFGIAAASSPKGPHGGAGLSETFDISQAIARLRASGVDVTAGYDVTIVPVKGANDAAVQIGRIADRPQLHRDGGRARAGLAGALDLPPCHPSRRCPGMCAGGLVYGGGSACTSFSFAPIPSRASAGKLTVVTAGGIAPAPSSAASSAAAPTYRS